MSHDQPHVRPAREADVPAIAAIFATDTLGGHGDTTDPEVLPQYLQAFRSIAASGNQCLYVVEEGGDVVATFQTMITTTMPGRGTSAMIIEAVHTHPDHRGRGIGKLMIEYCIADAQARGLRLVQLTSNAKRVDAHRFYERLGFSPSHLGFKLKLK